jgi:hypothetical protein
MKINKQTMLVLFQKFFSLPFLKNLRKKDSSWTLKPIASEIFKDELWLLSIHKNDDYMYEVIHTNYSSCGTGSAHVIKHIILHNKEYVCNIREKVTICEGGYNLDNRDVMWQLKRFNTINIWKTGVVFHYVVSNQRNQDLVSLSSS